MAKSQKMGKTKMPHKGKNHNHGRKMHGKVKPPKVKGSQSPWVGSVSMLGTLPASRAFLKQVCKA